MKFIRIQCLNDFPWVPTKWVSLSEADLESFSCNQKPFLWLLSFSGNFLHLFQEAFLLLQCLICSLCIFILLVRIVPLNCVDTIMPAACQVTLQTLQVLPWLFMGHSFTSHTHALDVYNATLLVSAHVWSRRNRSMFAKTYGEHVTTVAPFSLCAPQLDE